MAEPNKYQFIDCLRGLAITGVAIVHVQLLVSPTSSILKDLASSGALGVQLFFLVSALTLGLSANSRSKQNEPLMWRSFYLRRFFRIAPMFYMVILLYFLVGNLLPWKDPALEHGWVDVGSALLFVNGWIPRSINAVVPGGWSVAIEMSFYLIFPLIWSHLNSFRLTVWLAAAAYGIGLLVKKAAEAIYLQIDPAMPTPDLDVFLGLWLPSQLFVFVAGHGVYLLLRDRLKGRVEMFKPKTGLHCLIIGASLFILMAFVSGENLIQVLAMAIWIVGLAIYPTRLLVNKIFALMGKVSYSFYLLHFVVISVLLAWWDTAFAWVPEGDLGYFIALIIVVVLSTAVSWLTYTFIETPGIHFGKWVIGKLQKSPAGQSLAVPASSTANPSAPTDEGAKREEI